MGHNKLERIANKIKVYVPCSYAGRKIPAVRPRKSLMKLSNNSVIPRIIDKRQRRERVLRGLYGCKLCGIHICNHIAC